MSRLKNWAFTRDMFCTNQQIMSEILFQILKVDMLFGEITTDYFPGIMTKCSCAITQDGFEAALTFYCSKLSPNLVGNKFDEFLRKLDESMDILIEKLGRQHNIAGIEEW